ncbi:MAG: hypothetical protein ABI193_24050 [Minicystis sp.]
MSGVAVEPGAKDDEAAAEISVEQYAGITAALADDLPLDAILDNEGLDPPAWKPVDAVWKQRLAEGGASSPLFTTFLARRSEAEDILARKVRPLDDDLAAWTTFLQAYGAHASPFDLLAAQGLGLPDLSRLQRRWSRRLTADQELSRKAAELAAKAPGPLPPLTVEPLVLKRFPWSTGPRARPAVSDEAGEAAREGLDELPLDRYAALRAELAEPNVELRILAPRYAVEPARFEALDALWKQRLGANPALQRDYQRLFEHQRARLRRPAEGRSEAPRYEPARHEPARLEALPLAPPRIIDAPSVALPAPNRLAGTSLALDVPRGLELPFVAGEAPEEIRESSAEEAPRARPPGLGGTSLAVDVPRGPALPFAGQKAPVPAPPPNKLAGTALAVDVPRSPALPFVEGEAPEEIRVASSEKPPPPRASSLGGTALAVDVPRAPELPFTPDPAKAKKLEVRMFELPAHLRGVGVSPAPATPKAAPAKAPAPAPLPLPALSIEQYASLHVELSAAPGRAAEVLTRYRLTETQRAAMERHFQGRFQRESGLRATFDQACATYRGWLRSQGRG